MTKSVKEILTGSAELIMKGGLCKNTYWTPDGAHCALGAICALSGSGWRRRTGEAGEALQAAITRSGCNQDIADWNDDPERTKEEVADMLLRAATYVVPQ